MAGHSKLLTGFQTVMLVLRNDSSDPPSTFPNWCSQDADIFHVGSHMVNLLLASIFLHQQDVYIIKKYMESQKQLLIHGVRLQF